MKVSEDQKKMETIRTKVGIRERIIGMG